MYGWKISKHVYYLQYKGICLGVCSNYLSSQDTQHKLYLP